MAGVTGEERAGVYIEVWTGEHGRNISIGLEDEKGSGHGYRIAGPKMCACCHRTPLVRHKLDAHDVAEIRHYLDKVQDDTDRTATRASATAPSGPASAEPKTTRSSP
ncbi:MAG: hypothetical protein LC798_03205 [Chloroflexi bacterium]|nr:hypothetical protein [Chloroflexota bacterium]